MTLSPTVATRLEKTVVVTLITIPLLGLLFTLWGSMQNPEQFWKMLALIGVPTILFVAHVQLVRPKFRQLRKIAEYQQIIELLHKTRKRPRLRALVLGSIPSRVCRSVYRVAWFALLCWVFVQVYAIQGHHLLWFVGMYLVTGLGVTLGYHRGGHNAYKAHPIVRTTLFVFGCTAVQGPPGEWIRKHTKHHQFPETSWDVHSPFSFRPSVGSVIAEQIRSFWHSFVGWAINAKSLQKPFGLNPEQWKQKLISEIPPITTFKCRPEDEDYWNGIGENGIQFITRQEILRKRWEKMANTFLELEKDKAIRFLSNPLIYFGIVVISIAIPYAVGGISVWESLARICVLNVVTYCVNSVCHLWGEMPFKVHDNSRANAYVELFALGEGSHRPHHRAAGWAVHGIFHWQLDIAYEVLKLLKRVGLVTKLNLPSQKEIREGWRTLQQNSAAAP